MGKGAIPDRWTDYEPIGKKVEGTRFIAFKVPLKQHISGQADSDKRLDESILLQKIPNLGLIIDLTNTKRYYDPSVFKKNGIQYKKIMIPGKEVPPVHLTNNFISIVKDFVETNKDNDKLIGVHCTHGVNRTGYLICKYMISQLTIEPKDAMDKFAKARGYKIERTNYIEDLEVKPNATTINWREREQLDVQQPNNWRERHENHYNMNDRKSLHRHHPYRNHRHRSRSISPNSSASYRNNNRSNNRYSYQWPERYTDDRYTMTNRQSRLATDYYSRPAIDRKHYSNNRFSNSYRRDNL